jgi:hypothetical protein
MLCKEEQEGEEQGEEVCDYVIVICLHLINILFQLFSHCCMGEML